MKRIHTKSTVNSPQSARVLFKFGFNPQSSVEFGELVDAKNQRSSHSD